MASSKQQNNISELNKTLECKKMNKEFLPVEMINHKKSLNSVTENTVEKEQLNEDYKKHLKPEDTKGKN